MTAPLRVLYLHPFGVLGGATKSLFEMYSALPPGTVQGTAIAPSGAASRLLESAGLSIINVRGISQWDDTRFGHYRGFRWLILLREISYWPSTIKGLRAARASGDFDVVHCNEVTALLAGVVAKRMVRAPLLVHVRSLQRSDRGILTRWLQNLLRRRADAVVAIDQAVRRTLPSDLPVEVVHNGMALPAQSPARAASAVFCVATIGVLHQSKGVYELLEAVRLLRDRGIRIRLMVVGANIRELSGFRGWILRKLDLAHDVRGNLEKFVAKESLGDMVEFTGFVSDVSRIYGMADVVCFPSHLDAPGRPVFEAALHAVPAIVAMRNPTDDVVVHGRTGLCIDEPTPVAIAAAIEELQSDRARSRDMGSAAHRMALTRFTSNVSANKILGCYQRLRREPVTR
jgi:glycosyltransferase involved in cell wall biosynthesis